MNSRAFIAKYLMLAASSASAAADANSGEVPTLRAAWLRPKQADLIPDKGQFR
jgi:hypothetical protein